MGTPAEDRSGDRKGGEKFAIMAWGRGWAHPWAGVGVLVGKWCVVSGKW